MEASQRLGLDRWIAGRQREPRPRMWKEDSHGQVPAQSHWLKVQPMVVQSEGSSDPLTFGL
jgi:hypothetical protein